MIIYRENFKKVVNILLIIIKLHKVIKNYHRKLMKKLKFNKMKMKKNILQQYKIIMKNRKKYKKKNKMNFIIIIKT